MTARRAFPDRSLRRTPQTPAQHPEDKIDAVLLKAKKPAMERHFVVRDAFAHRRMVGVTRDILRAIEHDVFYPVLD